MDLPTAFKFGEKLGIGRDGVQKFNLENFIIIGVNCQGSQNHDDAKNLLNAAKILIEKSSFGKDSSAGVWKKEKGYTHASDINESD